jgi:hypothetical protein
MLGRGPADAFAVDFPELSLIEETSHAISQPLSEANLASFLAGATRIPQGAMSLPTIDADSDITASSFRMGLGHAFPTFGASEAAAHSRGLQGFSPTMFEPFFRDVFSVKEETSQFNEQEVAPLLHAPDAGALVAELDQSVFTQTSSNGVQLPQANLDNGLMFDLMIRCHAESTQAPHTIHDTPPSVMSTSPQPPPPPASAHVQKPTRPSDLIYDPSQPPLYTQQDIEHVLPPSLPMLTKLCPVDKAPADPSTEELQQYREFPRPILVFPLGLLITVNSQFMFS